MDARPRHLVLNLLLGAPGRRLAAREAVAACALFGIRENAARVTLTRLSAAGMVEATGRGEYHLGPAAARLADEVAAWRHAEGRVRDWHGGWVVAHVGDLARSDRAALRIRDRALGLLGLRALDRGLFVRPDNLAGGVGAVRERLAKLGLGSEAAVFVAREFDAAREQRAASLWNDASLSRGYRETGTRLEAWLARADSLPIETAARESFLLGNEAIRQWVFDPLLPAPLVDPRARRAFVDAVLRFDVAGHEIWNRFLRGDDARRAGGRARSAPDRGRPARRNARAAATPEVPS